MQFDVAIIGGGPAGLASALSASEQGARVVILERDNCLGGILNQCIHNGFGLHYFGEELTGAEYANKFIEKVNSDSNITVLLSTMVLEVAPTKIFAVNSSGVLEIVASSIVLAMGCRERTRGAINIVGSRPSGIMNAGTAQKLVNLDGQKVGDTVVILGSGDIGLIMARRMTYMGANVKMVCEVMPYSSGLNRNKVQCLDDYNIPLLLNTTIIDVIGRERLEAIVIATVDEKTRQPIPSTARRIECDTLLLSVGLIPENDLSFFLELDNATKGAVVDNRRQTSVGSVFACGNVLHVHDLVDNVSGEAAIAGKNAALFAQGKLANGDNKCRTVSKNSVSYIVPQFVVPNSGVVKLYFRVKKAIKNAVITVEFGSDNKQLITKKRLIVTPGEMEFVEVDTNGLKSDITVSV